MDIKVDLYLNQLSQGVKPVDRSVDWFVASANEAQLQILRRLVFFIIQSGGVGNDVAIALRESGLKSTFTPSRILLAAFHQDPNGSAKLKRALSEILNLPISEREKSFKLLLHLFFASDKRKREKGLQPDKYWWHRDLSDVDVVNKILSDDKRCD